MLDRLNAAKDLIKYARNGQLKILQYNGPSIFDLAFRMQLRQNVKADLNNPTLNGRGFSITNLNTTLILMRIEDPNLKMIFEGVNVDLIQQLFECALACERCALLCLGEKDPKEMQRCIELDRDCADTCLHNIKLLVRESDISQASLAVCEEICRLCATECRRHDHDHCRLCAEACERCAEACHHYQSELQLR